MQHNCCLLFYSIFVLLLYSFLRNFAAVISRSQKAKAAKAGKSSTKSAEVHAPSPSSGVTTHPADVDSVMIVNDETLIADQSTAAIDQSRNTAAKPSASVSTTSYSASSANVPAKDTDVSAPKSTSRLFDLVNADSPVARVSSHV